MNIHIIISILRNKDVPRKRAEVPSIMDEANLERNPESPDADAYHLSITDMITVAGMNERSESANMQCLPKTVRRSIISQKYNGGLSAYGSPWLVNVKRCPSARASSAILRYLNSLPGVKSLMAIIGASAMNIRMAADAAGYLRKNFFMSVCFSSG